MQFTTALALGAAAYRLNNSNYVSQRNWYQGMVIQGLAVERNITIIKKIQDNQAAGEKAIPGYAVTAADNELASLMYEHFKGLLFTRLARELSGFEKNLITLLETDNVGRWDMGLVGYLPELYHKEVKQEAVDAELSAAGSSAPVGQVGQKVTLNVKVVDTKRFALYNNYLYTCLTEDSSVVKFFHGTLATAKTLTIKGRVKSYSKDQYDNYVTSLNYIRIS